MAGQLAAEHGGSPAEPRRTRPSQGRTWPSRPAEHGRAKPAPAKPSPSPGRTWPNPGEPGRSAAEPFCAHDVRHFECSVYISSRIPRCVGGLFAATFTGFFFRFAVCKAIGFLCIIVPTSLGLEALVLSPVGIQSQEGTGGAPDAFDIP